MVLGYADEEVNRFFGKALFAVGEDWGMDELLPDVYKRQVPVRVRFIEG